MSNNNTNLTDYILERAYSKDESYTKSDVDTLIQTINEKEVDIFELVLELPVGDAIKSNKLYLKYNEDNDGNLFDVFFYVNGGWEQLDSFDFNISDYYNINQIDDLLQSKASSSQLNTVRSNLETVRGNLTNLYTNLTDFNEVLINFDDDNSNLSDDLSKLKDNLGIFIDRVDGLITALQTLQSDFSDLNDDLNGDGQNTGLKGELSSLQESLYGDENDNTDNGIVGDIQKLKSDTSTMNTNLNRLWDNLTDANGELVIAGGEIVIFSQELNEFLSDLSVLGGYLSSFEGNLTQFKNQLRNDDVSFNTFELESNILSLFANIGIVKSDITGLQDRADTIEDDVGNVNVALYGSSNGDISNYTNDSLFGTIESVQDDITEITETTIPSVTDSIDTVTTGISAANSRIDSAISTINQTNTAISNVSTNMSEVQEILYGEDGDKDNPDNNTVLKNISNVQTDMVNVQDDISSINTTIGDNNNGLIKQVNTAQSNIVNANNSITDLQTELYVGGENGTTSNPAENTVMRNIIDINDINSMIKNAIDNLFTPPSKFNENVTYIYIPFADTGGNPADAQELRIMEYNYNFPISKTNYIYKYRRNYNEGSLFKRTGTNSWSQIFLDEDGDVENEFGEKQLMFVCYDLTYSELNGQINEAGFTPLRINYLYEISTKKYYELGIVGD